MKRPGVAVLFLVAGIASSMHSEMDTASAGYIEIENYINGNESELPSPAEL